MNASLKENLPYRAGVGVMLVNADNRIFVGQRFDSEVEAWQMPQGGIDAGEDPSVAAAIEEHWKPQGPSDRVPTSPVSIAVALADKLDTLVGFWAIDEKPTGSKDPFALRRAALGVIRIVLENSVRLPIAGFAARTPDLLAFFADRLKVQLREQGTRFDLVDAVFALGGQDDLLLIVKRVEALGALLALDDNTLLDLFMRKTPLPEELDTPPIRGLLDTLQRL